MTIIVLLILAGISISMIAGNNGILPRAGQARDLTGVKQIAERVQLAYLASLTEGKGKSTEQLLRDELDKEFGANKYELSEDLTKVIIDEKEYDVGGAVSKSNTLVAMFQKAEEDGCTNADGSCTREDHLHIGDYVNYTNPASGEYTVPAGELGGEDAQTYLASQNQLNWRVLGIEGTGDTAYIKLIAGSPMKKSKADKSGTDESNPYLYMKGAKSYINAIEQLNKICAICKNETLATKAESVTMDDIDKLTGVTTVDLKKQYNLYQFFGGKNYDEDYSFENHYTPTSWLNSTKTTVSGKVNGYYYSINSQYGSNPYVTMSNTRIYNMLFDNVQLGSGRAYWLASVGVNAHSDYAGFGPAIVYEDFSIVGAGTGNLFDSDGVEGVGSLAVRPVVFLESGVTSEQCSKTTDKTETVWNYGG